MGITLYSLDMLSLIPIIREEFIIRASIHLKTMIRKDHSINPETCGTVKFFLFELMILRCPMILQKNSAQ